MKKGEVTVVRNSTLVSKILENKRERERERELRLDMIVLRY